MTIPKGSIAVTSSYPIVRDKDTFDCSDEWLPSRWEDPSHEMKMAFIPFKIGRRSCPGPWAVTGKDQVRELLACLVMDYEWSLVKETHQEDSISLMIMWTILQTGSCLSLETFCETREGLSKKAARKR
jgi:cytochrome P450